MVGNKVSDEPRTANPELRTPNSELRTPNGEWWTVNGNSNLRAHRGLRAVILFDFEWCSDLTVQEGSNQCLKTLSRKP